METLMNNQQTLNKELQSQISPESAIALLKNGNDRFLKKNMIDRDLHQQVALTAKGQFPFAAVLGCIDSRVPAETIFDLGIGDIFNVRIAGNFVNDDILGSLEFACKVAGAKVIMVLGHTSCGAVKGAINDVKLGNLTGMLDKIKPAVKIAKASNGKHSHDSPEFANEVAHMNVVTNINAILERSEILKEMVDKGEIAIAGGMYNVETGTVNFIQ